MTRAPSVAVRVAPARKPSVVQLSGMSSHSGPIWGIWMRWSITEIEVKPDVLGGPGEVGEPGRELGGATGPGEAADLQAEGERHGVLLLTSGARRAR